MKVTKRETAFEGKYLRLVRKTSVTPTNEEVIWETVERTNVCGNGAVGIVALTRKGEFILERHWRAPIESYVIQFPGGLTDNHQESPEETARRELREETGYEANELVLFLSVPTCPGLSSSTVGFYFAPEVEYTGDVKRDIAEEMEILTIPKNDLPKFLLNLPDNTILDLKVPGIIWLLATKRLI